jgi:hypothetical protein
VVELQQFFAEILGALVRDDPGASSVESDHRHASFRFGEYVRNTASPPKDGVATHPIGTGVPSALNTNLRIPALACPDTRSSSSGLKCDTDRTTCHHERTVRDGVSGSVETESIDGIRRKIADEQLTFL